MRWFVWGFSVFDAGRGTTDRLLVWKSTIVLTLALVFFLVFFNN